MLRTVITFFSSCVVALSLRGAASDDARRFFDFTPLSAANPAVATIDGTLQIPLSELRAYRNGERLQAKTDTPAQKRALLDALIDEYLFVDDAYRAGVAASPRFTKQMEATRTMILTDFMTTRALQEKKPGETGDAAATLAERLFDTAKIDVSNEAFDIVKRAAKRLDATAAASKRGPIIDSTETAAAKLHAIINAAPEAVVVSYESRTLSIHQLLSIYSGLPAPRPDVQTQEGFITLIKPLIMPELMALEAVKRGIAADPEFQNKLVQNQNALLRFHVHGAIESRANDVLRGSDLEEKLRAWYRDHAAAYAVPAANGEKKIPSFADARGRALADFSVELCEQLQAEKARELRQLRRVAIDEQVLQSL